MTNILHDALIGRHRDNDATFLVCDDGARISFDGLRRRAAQLAHVLREAGVEPGDRVLVQAPKRADTVALYAACLQAGAVYLPLNTAYTPAEVDYFIADAAPRLIVAEAEVPGATTLTLTAEGGSLSRAADRMPDRFDTVARGPDDLAALLYTSGTTGRSKGAMLSHDNLLSNAQSLTDLWEITAADRLIHALPIFHTHGLFVALNTALLAGAEVRLMAGFDLDGILAELPRSTLLMGVPTFYTRLLQDDRLAACDLSGFRLFISGSAPLLAETHRAFHAATGHRILERYGMTETNMITSNPYRGERVAGTVGFALPGVEVQVTDPDTGAALPPDEIGMIEVRGANVFRGYWNMPEKTAAEMRPDGFFITGDLGTAAADGRIAIVGRAKDLIISGGYNIYPKEIEDALNDLPGIAESAVFGLPHPEYGETVAAALVPAPGATLDTDVIAAAIAERLARFKHPRRYITLDALPRNTMGKVQKNLLREQHG